MKREGARPSEDLWPQEPACDALLSSPQSRNMAVGQYASNYAYIPIVPFLSNEYLIFLSGQPQPEPEPEPVSVSSFQKYSETPFRDGEIRIEPAY